VVEHRLPAPPGLGESASLEVQVAEAVGRVIADAGDEVAVEDGLEMPGLRVGADHGRVGGLIHPLRRLAVEKQPDRVAAGRRQAGQRIPHLPAHRQVEPVPGREQRVGLGLVHLVEHAERFLPTLRRHVSAEVLQRVEHLVLGPGDREAVARLARILRRLTGHPDQHLADRRDAEHHQDQRTTDPASPTADRASIV